MKHTLAPILAGRRHPRRRAGSRGRPRLHQTTTPAEPAPPASTVPHEVPKPAHLRIVRGKLASVGSQRRRSP